LDVDAREALVQALNEYDGAVILISHDRHMVELTADRLVLVDDGRAVDYAGSIEDYIDLVLGRNQPKADAKPKAPKGAKAREDAKALKKATDEAEKESLRLAEQRSELDRAMFNPSGADPQLARLSMSELSQRRAKVAAALEEAEARWMALAEKLEREAA
jgi:ATP-binding cassette subfamily F protein 3